MSGGCGRPLLGRPGSGRGAASRLHPGTEAKAAGAGGVQQVNQCRVRQKAMLPDVPAHSGCVAPEARTERLA
eukprot:3150907-Pyramimonas_sp.AAC.1